MGAADGAIFTRQRVQVRSFDVSYLTGGHDGCSRDGQHADQGNSAGRRGACRDGGLRRLERGRDSHRNGRRSVAQSRVVGRRRRGYLRHRTCRCASSRRQVGRRCARYSAARAYIRRGPPAVRWCHPSLRWSYPSVRCSSRPASPSYGLGRGRARGGDWAMRCRDGRWRLWRTLSVGVGDRERDR